MKLIDFMRERQMDDDQLATLVGGVTSHAVKKWKYGEREPSSLVMARIHEITEGLVSLPDWAAAAALRSARIKGAA